MPGRHLQLQQKPTRHVFPPWRSSQVVMSWRPECIRRAGGKRMAVAERGSGANARRTTGRFRSSESQLVVTRYSILHRRPDVPHHRTADNSCVPKFSHHQSHCCRLSKLRPTRVLYPRNTDTLFLLRSGMSLCLDKRGAKLKILVAVEGGKTGRTVLVTYP